MALVTSLHTDRDLEERGDKASQLSVVPPPPSQGVQVRCSVDRLGIASAARAAGALSAVVATAFVGSTITAWWAATRIGLVAGFEEAVASGLGLDSWSIPIGAIFMLVLVLAIGFAILTVATVILLVVVYNRVSGVVGGIDVTARAELLDPLP